MSIAEMKQAAIAKINKLNAPALLVKILKLLSKISLAKEHNPSDRTQHYKIAKRRHAEILKKFIE